MTEGASDSKITFTSLVFWSVFLLHYLCLILTGTGRERRRWICCRGHLIHFHIQSVIYVMFYQVQGGREEGGSAGHLIHFRIQSVIYVMFYQVQGGREEGGSAAVEWSGAGGRSVWNHRTDRGQTPKMLWYYDLIVLFHTVYRNMVGKWNPWKASLSCAIFSEGFPHLGHAKKIFWFSDNWSKKYG